MPERFQILRGDCREVLKSLTENSVEAVVCDPPYDLTANKKGGTGPASVNLDSPYGRARITTGFMGKSWDGTGVAFDPATWVEVLRVLKPGGHLLAFGGSRTYHRMACAVEDAGFEIRDQIMWLYGSGFPKSLDVQRSIDTSLCVMSGRHYWAEASLPKNGNSQPDDHVCPFTDEDREHDGEGTALKPAHEPIVLARKPLVGTVAENVLNFSAGSLAIEACRVDVADNEGYAANFSGDRGHDGTRDEGATGSTNMRMGGGKRPLRVGDYKETANSVYAGRMDGSLAGGSKADGETDLGRWPANVLHDGSDEVLAAFPNAPGQQRALNGSEAPKQGTPVYGDYGPRPVCEPRLDSGSAARFFYCSKASKEDRDEGLERLADKFSRETVNREADSAGAQNPRAGAGRGAGAPIFRCSICGLNLQGGRAATLCNAGQPHSPQLIGHGEARKNHHPTVKPTDLMRYLCRLVTPSGGTVLDPFMGSGSTGKAAMLEGLNFIGIEMSAEYVEIAEKRIAAAAKQGLLFA